MGTFHSKKSGFSEDTSGKRAARGDAEQGHQLMTEDAKDTDSDDDASELSQERIHLENSGQRYGDLEY